MQVRNDIPQRAAVALGTSSLLCSTAALFAPYLFAAATITCRRVLRRVRVRYDVVFTLWHSVKRWGYVAIGGDDAANDAPFLFSLKDCYWRAAADAVIRV